MSQADLSTSLIQHLVRAVDAVQATHGLGVVARRGGRIHRLRPQGVSGATVVFEFRDPLPVSPYLKKNATSADFAAYHARQFAGEPGWSVRKPAGAAPAERPAGRPRTPNTQVASEWIALGFNCGGAALSWIGLVGATALLPATAGGSSFAIPFAYAGALASSAQCGFSVYRTLNAEQGREATNKWLDNQKWYVVGMWGADAIGLVGAGGALVEMKRGYGVIKAARSTVGTAATGRLNRVVRRELTVSLGLQGSEAGSNLINQAVRQKLLEGVGGVIGVAGSAQSGILADLFVKDVIVWITSEKGH